MVKRILNHWKFVLIITLLIGALILVKITDGIISRFSTPGITGICKLDGHKFGVFESKEEAIQNPIGELTRETHTVTVSGGKGNKDISTGIKYLINPIITRISNDEFSLNLTNVEENKTIVATVKVGGDGSITQQIMKKGKNIKTYFFSFSVEPSDLVNMVDSVKDNKTTMSTHSSQQTTILPTNDGSTSYLGFGTSPEDFPTGKFSIGDTTMTTYSSESAAEEAVEQKKQTLPAKWVDNLPVSVIVSKNTARVRIKVSNVNSDDANYSEILIDKKDNWAGTMNLSELCGNRVTLMVQYEDRKVSNCGFQYVSFYLPSYETVEQFRLQQSQNVM